MLHAQASLFHKNNLNSEMSLECWSCWSSKCIIFRGWKEPLANRTFMPAWVTLNNNKRKSWLVVWLEHSCSSEGFAASRHQRLKLEPADHGPGAILLIQLDPSPSQWQQWHSPVLWSNSLYLHCWSCCFTGHTFDKMHLLQVILQQSKGPQGHLASRSAGINST